MSFILWGGHRALCIGVLELCVGRTKVVKSSAHPLLEAACGERWESTNDRNTNVFRATTKDRNPSAADFFFIRRRAPTTLLVCTRLNQLPRRYHNAFVTGSENNAGRGEIEGETGLPEQRDSERM